MPTNIAPKHDGQDVVVRVEPQYSQRAASGPAAGAPQVGQLSEAGIAPNRRLGTSRRHRIHAGWIPPTPFRTTHFVGVITGASGFDTNSTVRYSARHSVGVTTQLT